MRRYFRPLIGSGRFLCGRRWGIEEIATLNSEGFRTMIFHVTMEPVEDGWIMIECPALPGCISQGKDELEALTNIKEAITAWLWTADQSAVNRLPLDRRSVMVLI